LGKSIVTSTQIDITLDAIFEGFKDIIIGENYLS
jgi:hypothetical protein